VVLIAALLAGGVYLRLRTTSEADAATADTGTAAPTSASSAFASDVAIPVEGVPAVRDTLVLGVSAAGEAAAWRRAVVSAQVGGRVASVAVRENDAVGAGRLLVALDPAEYQLAVEEAEAALRDAAAKYRELTLLDDEIADAGTRQERARIARARSGLDQAEVRLKKARLDLARTRFTAPFAGRVASVQVVPGQWVRPGDELLRVVDLDPIKVEVQVLESEVGLLAAGRSARVELAAFPGERFAGRIETINPLVESGTRTAKVTVLVPNPQGRVLPGMYARVALDAHRYPDRVLVPRSALLERDRRSMLFVYEAGGGAEGGRAKWRYVTPGLANDSLVEIVPDVQTDSVRPGEVVLTGGHYTLVHDARVRLVENAGAAGGRPD
jgi:HlyD family secretion protein